MWRPEFINLLYTYLGIKPKMRVADIGSGTGFLADLIATRIGDNGLVTRIDHDKELLIPVSAESLQRSRRSIYSIQADAYNCPVRSSWADLAVCQYLLSNVSRPLSIIREMVRITKVGGTVAAIEPIGVQILFDPANPRSTNLQWKRWNAIIKGYKKVFGMDRTIGFQIPTLFMKAGLSRVELDGYMQTVLLCDPRYDRKDVSNFLSGRFFERVQPRRGKVANITHRLVFSSGGMSPSQASQIRRQLNQRLRPLIMNPKLMGKDAFIFCTARVIVRGRKNSRYDVKAQSVRPFIQTRGKP
jgi:SAM-dependent methyltransferase